MKNLFLSLFILLFTSALFANGVVEGVIHDVKTGAPICEIPKKYLGNDGKLMAPIEVTVTQSKNSSHYYSKELNLELPTTGFLEIRIGSYYFYKQL